MARKRQKLGLMFCMPIDKGFKDRIDREADREERSSADMGRVLMREALDLRDQKRASEQPAEAAGVK